MKPLRSVAAFVFVSKKADSVVETLSKRAKEASKQFTGTRPAVIVLNLVDPIDKEELASMLRRSNGLHEVAATIFDAPGRAFVNAIAYTVPQTARRDGLGATAVGGNALVLYNPSPRFVCDAIGRIFSCEQGS